MTDSLHPDDPIDVAAVAATDALVERLRAALHTAEVPRDAVVWGDDDDDVDEPGYALLSALQRDVSAEQPAAVATGAAVIAFDSRRRGLGRVATVAAVTAGVLSVAGAAAATSAPGDALYGVRTAVSSAVGSVIDVVTPDRPVGPKRADGRVGASATDTAGIRGDQVSDQARSTNAVRQITQRLTTANRLIADQKWTSALNVLSAAERSLDVVLPGDRGTLALQIDALQAAALSGQAADRADDKGNRGSDTGTRPDRSGSSGKTADDGDRPDSSGSGRGSDAGGIGGAPAVRSTAVRGGSGPSAGGDDDLLDGSRSGSGLHPSRSDEGDAR